MTWQFAVSTLGMPGVPMPEAIKTAVSHGCDGLEIRAHLDEEVHIGLSERNTSRVRSQIADAGLEVACVAGYAKVCASGPDEPVITELRALIDLAHRLGAPSIRVFPGGDGTTTDVVARERIGAVLDELRDSGVRLLVETHDSHPTGEAAVRLVEPFAEPRLVAVLWDALHPWRHGEEPARTREVLGDYLGYFQLKDVASPSELTPLAPGEGTIPLAELHALLTPWSGWVSLEWEKAWYPTIGSVDAPLRAAASWLTTPQDVDML